MVLKPAILGQSLIEVLVGLVLLGIIMVPAANYFLNARASLHGVEDRDEVDELTETLRNLLTREDLCKASFGGQTLTGASNVTLSKVTIAAVDFFSVGNDLTAMGGPATVKTNTVTLVPIPGGVETFPLHMVDLYRRFAWLSIDFKAVGQNLTPAPQKIFLSFLVDASDKIIECSTESPSPMDRRSDCEDVLEATYNVATGICDLNPAEYPALNYGGYYQLGDGLPWNAPTPAFDPLRIRVDPSQISTGTFKKFGNSEASLTDIDISTGLLIQKPESGNAIMPTDLVTGKKPYSCPPGYVARADNSTTEGGYNERWEKWVGCYRVGFLP